MQWHRHDRDPAGGGRPRRQIGVLAERRYIADLPRQLRGLRLVDGPPELRVLSRPEPVALAHCYLRTGGIDLELHGIGREIWRVRTRSLTRSGGACDAAVVSAGGEPEPVTPEPRADERLAAHVAARRFGRVSR